MMRNKKYTFECCVTILMAITLAASAQAQQDLVTADRFVPHISTVAANAGNKVGLFLHEKLSRSMLDKINSGENPHGRVVLFVHGNSISAVPDFDLPYQDYSWMAYLAAAGFDTFTMDHTGYGYSPRPEMDNPCNLDVANQELLIPSTLGEKCSPAYNRILTNSESDWDEIDTVVDFLRELRRVPRVSLIGWSWGGPRSGGYAARYPDKVDKLVLFAPGYNPAEPSVAPAVEMQTGVPMSLQTRQALMQSRWRDSVACDGQIEPGIQDAIWPLIMAYDALGSVWHPQGVMRVRTTASRGWNEEYAGRVLAPTLILVGEQDFLLSAANELYPDLTGTENKVLVKMECATHFALWEATQYRFMHEASREWLLNGSFRGQTTGVFEQSRSK